MLSVMRKMEWTKTEYKKLGLILYIGIDIKATINDLANIVIGITKDERYYLLFCLNGELKKRYVKKTKKEILKKAKEIMLLGEL